MSETDEMKRRHNFGFLFKEIQHLHKRVNELENNQQKPAEPKRKTLWEICQESFNEDRPGTIKESWEAAAKAVAEAIIERHIPINYAKTIEAIRKEFEE